MSSQPAGEARTIVITGGNGGLGYGCATALVSSLDGPWHVVVASRNAGHAQEAVDKLASAVRAGHTAEAMSLDLASLTSVRAFAAELTSRVASGTIPPLQALVCNAGVQAGTKQTQTADGFESTFGVNHLGHFLFVNEMLPVLRAPARVVVVASGVHDPAQKASVPVPAWNTAPALARGELGPDAASDNAFVARSAPLQHPQAGQHLLHLRPGPPPAPRRHRQRLRPRHDPGHGAATISSRPDPIRRKARPAPRQAPGALVRDGHALHRRGVRHRAGLARDRPRAGRHHRHVLPQLQAIRSSDDSYDVETEVSSGTGWPMSLGEWDKRGWCPLHGHDHLEASQVRVLTEFSSPTGAQEVKGW
jgi:NAD(P)-dependent dehydrogenase (short-subunit alcohol dehydrogenase family)